MAELTGIAYVNTALAERDRQLDAADREIDALRCSLAAYETAVAGITPALAAAEARGYQRAVETLRLMIQGKFDANGGRMPILDEAIMRAADYLASQATVQTGDTQP